MKTWITVIGTGEDGLAGLTPEHRQKVLEADFVVAAKRHVAELKKVKDFTGEAHPWPSPFSEVVTLVDSWEGFQVVALATGDPLWYGAASTLVRRFGPDQMEVHPAPSGFQLAAARMGWPMHTVECLTVHGRLLETILPYLAPKARLLVFAHDRHSTRKLSSLLVDAGFWNATVTALGHIGGEKETRQELIAGIWAKQTPGSKMPAPPDFHVVAIECHPEFDPILAKDSPPRGFLPRVPGLPEDAYGSDGNITKSEIRAVTLARLAPHPGGVLWDLGCGSGSIGIEWMRAAKGAIAVGIDNREDRLELAVANAKRLGAVEWGGRYGNLPVAATSSSLPDPDAVFIGGGLSAELVRNVLGRLPVGGRLVANAVTVESEELLIGLWREHGGDLVRLSSSRIESIGGRHGWRPLMPVTQWSLVKPRDKAKAASVTKLSTRAKPKAKSAIKPRSKSRPKPRAKSKNSGRSRK